MRRVGNTAPGDGCAYRGRGLVQVTGRANYKRCGDGLGVDLISQPELLEQPRYAALSAACFFYVNGLNSLADAGAIQDIGSIINTGKPGRRPKGAEDRRALYESALKVLA